MEQNYKRITMRPEHFADYLIDVVGFSSFELVGVPQAKAKGNLSIDYANMFWLFF